LTKKTEKWTSMQNLFDRYYCNSPIFQLLKATWLAFTISSSYVNLWSKIWHRQSRVALMVKT